MTIFVGSTNPVKINSVRLAASGQWPQAEVTGFSTQSGISEQPMSDEETRTGAQNRARSALEQGLKSVAPAKLKKLSAASQPILAIGLEGGVFITTDDEMWSTVWAVLIDTNGNQFESNGARVKVPSVVAEAIRSGQEMGPIMQKLTGEVDVRQKQGMFGIITNNFVTRTEEYATIAKTALGLWYGQGWDKALHLTP